MTKKKTKTCPMIGFRVSDKIDSALKSEAKRKGISLNKVVVDILMNTVGKELGKPQKEKSKTEKSKAKTFSRSSILSGE